jgi:hypothetical protein
VKLVTDDKVTLRIPLHEWQREVWEWVMGHGWPVQRRCAVLACGARSGKGKVSRAIAVCAALRLAIERKGDRALVPRVNVWVVAPTKTLYAQCWKEIEDILPDVLITKYSTREGVIECRGGVRFAFKSSERPEALVAEGVDVLWVTEAARTRSNIVWHESLLPRLCSPGRYGLAIVESTPRSGADHWFTVLRRQAAECSDGSIRLWRLPTTCNPGMRGERLAMLMKRMPERIFRSEILAEDVDDEGRAFAAGDVDALYVGPVFDLAGPVIYGLDIARYQDQTVLLSGTGAVVDSMSLLHRMPLKDQIMYIVDTISKRPGRLVLDSTGMGGALFGDALRDAAPWLSIEGVDYRGGRKQEMFGSLVNAVERQLFKVSLPGDLWEVLRSQMLGLNIDFDGRVTKYYGKQDDTVSALALWWSGASRHVRNQDGFDVMRDLWAKFLT